MNAMNEQGRGELWFDALTRGRAPLAAYPASLRVCDAEVGGNSARFIAVVADPDNPFPRARNGETGLIEGWALAQAVRAAVAADRGQKDKRIIVAVIDVPSQAYGRREEAFGIHQALAAAAGAYAEARLAGHPVIGLIVGKAMSGAFLAHGYQANRLLALDDGGISIHAMGKASAARVTQRSVADLEAFAARIPPMAYDLDSYASLGLLWRRIAVARPEAPTGSDLDAVESALAAAADDIARDPQRDLRGRLGQANRQASARVRALLRAQWQAH